MHSAPQSQCTTSVEVRVATGVGKFKFKITLVTVEVTARKVSRQVKLYGLTVRFWTKSYGQTVRFRAAAYGQTVRSPSSASAVGAKILRCFNPGYRRAAATKRTPHRGGYVFGRARPA